MNREQAIATAQSALRLRHDVVHFDNGVWRWRKYGWKVTLWESGDVISAIDEWSFR